MATTRKAAKSDVPSNVRCGDCIHFQTGPAHHMKEDLCQNLGVRDYARAPDKCFCPDASQLTKAEINLPALGSQLRHLDASQLRVLGTMLTHAADLYRLGFQFGQPVFINLGSGDYLSNFFKGYVVGSGVYGRGENAAEHVYVSARLLGFDDDDEEHPNTFLRLLPDSLLTVADFKIKRERMEAAGRFEPPSSGRKGHRRPLAEALQKGESLLPPPEADVDYEVPTLDTAPVSWLEPFTADDLNVMRAAAKTEKVIKIEPKKGRTAKARVEERDGVRVSVVTLSTDIEVENTDEDDGDGVVPAKPTRRPAMDVSALSSKKKPAIVMPTLKRK